MTIAQRRNSCRALLVDALTETLPHIVGLQRQLTGTKAVVTHIRARLDLAF